jgi:hypothetical protein
MANRNFNDMQSLERQLKKINFEAAYVAAATASGTLDLTADITITSATTLSATPNGTTITLTVNAAAANPTDTVLAVVTGTASAIAIAITPNDGTNNGATPVAVTTAQLRELIATGDIAALSVTLTDASSLLDEISATGGDATALATGGEGDGEVATLSGGVTQDFTLTRNYGIYDITQTATGEYKIELEDKYNALNFAQFIVVGSTARDFTFQIKTYSVNPTSGRAYITIYALTAGSETQLNDGDILLGELTLKNTSVI